MGPEDTEVAACANADNDNLDVADDCPLDADNDADGDGVCGDIDVCWGDDAIGDTDGDGNCDDTDEWPICFDDGNDRMTALGYVMVLQL